MKKIIISDCSLRDGNHAVKHTISLDSIARYCKFADKAGIPMVQVGHGNGLSASSILIGRSPSTDREMLSVAKKNLLKSKLGIHIIPGLATIDDIKVAMQLGVDIYRVATHCTEATLAKSHIEFLKKEGKEVFGVFMMSALISTKEFVEQASIMQSYGAQTIVIMDSTGSFLPDQVRQRVKALIQQLGVRVAFHSHNNLGCAIANSLIAAQSGAEIIDGSIRGFGAGSGNSQLQVIIAVLQQNGFDLGIDFSLVIKEADAVTEYLVNHIPIITPINILTGLKRLFSGFEKPIISNSKLYGVEYSSLIFELGNRKLVAGQQDLITQIAKRLGEKNK